jgi:hypothetical protein
METLNGFAVPKKPLITPYPVLHMAILTVADTIFSYNYAKKGKTAEAVLPLIF